MSNPKKIWLSSPHMGENEQKYVRDAFESNWVAPLGPNVDGFEKAIEDYTQCGHVAALTTGTSAIHLALILLGVKPEDEVICSSFTFSASCNPIIYQGAIPVFIDSEKHTWNMCPVLLRQAIEDRMSKGKKPKAIILVHLYGMPAKMDEILVICNEFDIPLIEDAAEALGSSYKKQSMGTFGKFGILSFNGNKIITTSGGGALLSADEELIKKARFLATQARDNAPHYQHTHIGFNYRMSNICAGIGMGQMEVLSQRIEQKRNIFNTYKTALADIDGIKFVLEPTPDYFSNYWLTTIVVENNSKNVNRETIRLALEKENIESRPLWKPMHLQPVFEEYPAYTNGVSEDLFEKGLCLPSDSKMTEEDIQRVIKIIRDLFS